MAVAVVVIPKRNPLPPLPPLTPLPYGSLRFASLRFARLPTLAQKSPKTPYNWFLTLVQTSLIGFGGGWLMPIMLGLPSSFLLGGDINSLGCLISWYLVFHSPRDYFYTKICAAVPFQVFYTSFAQLFRATGIYGFVDKSLSVGMKPSAYYPTPLLGPVLTASLLSNIGPIFRLGYKEWFKVRRGESFAN